MKDWKISMKTIFSNTIGQHEEILHVKCRSWDKTSVYLSYNESKNNVNEGITKYQQGHFVCRSVSVVNKSVLSICWDTQVLKQPPLHQLMLVSE